MMRSVPAKATDDTYTADEFTEGVSQESQNLVLSSGQVLTAADLNQMGKAAAIYGGAGDFYTDSGGVNTYVLAPGGTRQTPPTLLDGMRVRFIAGNTNSGASTVNVNGIGVTPIEQGGSALVGGEIVAGAIIELAYNTSNGSFTVVYGLLADLGLGTPGDIDTYDANGAPVRLAIGAEDEVLTVNGSGGLGYSPGVAGGWIKHGTVHDGVTSGIEIDWTGIPAGVNKVNIIFKNHSFSGTAELAMRLGDAGGFETTGYTGSVSTSAGSDNWSANAQISRSALASNDRSGSVTLTRFTGNEWQITGSTNNAAGGATTFNGDKTLSGELTQLRLRSDNGSDTFDATGGGITAALYYQ